MFVCSDYGLVCTSPHDLPQRVTIHTYTNFPVVSVLFARAASYKFNRTLVTHVSVLIESRSSMAEGEKSSARLKIALIVMLVIVLLGVVAWASVLHVRLGKKANKSDFELSDARSSLVESASMFSPAIGHGGGSIEITNIGDETIQIKNVRMNDEAPVLLNVTLEVGQSVITDVETSDEYITITPSWPIDVVGKLRLRLHPLGVLTGDVNNFPQTIIGERHAISGGREFVVGLLKYGSELSDVHISGEWVPDGAKSIEISNGKLTWVSDTGEPEGRETGVASKVGSGSLKSMSISTKDDCIAISGETDGGSMQVQVVGVAPATQSDGVVSHGQLVTELEASAAAIQSVNDTRIDEAIANVVKYVDNRDNQISATIGGGGGGGGGGTLSIDLVDVASATYTITDDTALSYYGVSYTTTGACDVTLPLASAGGRLVDIIDTGSNASVHNVTISRQGSDTINGDISATLNQNGQSITLISDGTSSWYTR